MWIELHVLSGVNTCPSATADGVTTAAVYRTIGRSLGLLGVLAVDVELCKTGESIRTEVREEKMGLWATDVVECFSWAGSDVVD